MVYLDYGLLNPYFPRQILVLSPLLSPKISVMGKIPGLRVYKAYKAIVVWLGLINHLQTMDLYSGLTDANESYLVEQLISRQSHYA